MRAQGQKVVFVVSGNEEVSMHWAWLWFQPLKGVCVCESGEGGLGWGRRWESIGQRSPVVL